MTQNHDQRPVYRCSHCDLVQYAAANGLCRKCGQPSGPSPTVHSPSSSTRRTPAPPHIYSANIGRALRSLRLRAGITQRRLAQASGLYRSRLSKIESGLLVPSITTLECMAAELRVDLLDVLMLIRKQADSRAAEAAQVQREMSGADQPLSS